MTNQPQRNPAKRGRDLEQARVVAQITVRYLKHRPFSFEALRSFPRQLVADAMPLFESAD